MKISKLALVGLLSAIAMGCDENERAATTSPSSAVQASATTAAAEPPAPRAIPTSADPAPAAPAWGAAMVGKPVETLFSKTIAQCIGSADLVAMRFAAPQPTVRIDGWAWNVSGKSAFDRLVAVNDAGVVVGVGTTMYERPDVLAARVGVVTELVSGYQVYVPDAPGKVRIYGVDDAGTAACNFVEITI